MSKTIKKAKILPKRAYKENLISIFDFWADTKRAESLYCLTIIENLERLLVRRLK